MFAVTDLKFYLLREIYYATYAHPVHKTDLLQLPLGTASKIAIALADLEHMGYFKCDTGGDIVHIQPAGRMAYEEAQERRQKEAEHKSQKRFENKISVASVLVPCITFVLGLVVEFYVKVVEWVFRLFA